MDGDLRLKQYKDIDRQWFPVYRRLPKFPGDPGRHFHSSTVLSDAKAFQHLSALNRHLNRKNLLGGLKDNTQAGSSTMLSDFMPEACNNGG